MTLKQGLFACIIQKPNDKRLVSLVTLVCRPRLALDCHPRLTLACHPRLDRGSMPSAAMDTRSSRA